MTTWQRYLPTSISLFLHQDGDIHRHMYLRDVVTAIEYDEQPPT